MASRTGAAGPPENRRWNTRRSRMRALAAMNWAAASKSGLFFVFMPLISSPACSHRLERNGHGPCDPVSMTSWVPAGAWLTSGYAEWPAPSALREAVSCLWTSVVPDDGGRDGGDGGDGGGG